MGTITIYLILSIIVNLIFFLLYREQKEREQLQSQIIKNQKKQIELLKRLDELKKNPKSYPQECQLETVKDITCP